MNIRINNSRIDVWCERTHSAHSIHSLGQLLHCVVGTVIRRFHNCSTISYINYTGTDTHTHSSIRNVHMNGYTIEQNRFAPHSASSHLFVSLTLSGLIRISNKSILLYFSGFIKLFPKSDRKNESKYNVKMVETTNTRQSIVCLCVSVCMCMSFFVDWKCVRAYVNTERCVCMHFTNISQFFSLSLVGFDSNEIHYCSGIHTSLDTRTHT